MISALEGTVVALMDHGFLLAVGDGQPVAISTRAPSAEIDLRPGDEVRVLGGLHQGVFASSTASKRLPSGEWLAVEINETPGMRRRWRDFIAGGGDATPPKR
jgi:hypothetical protein